MKLLSKNQQTIQSIRDSDGVVVETTTRWQGAIITDDVKTIPFSFDHNPTDDELAALAPPPPQDINPTLSKAVLLPIMKDRIFEAAQFDWFNTKAQADGALTPAQKTGVANLNTQLYQRARAAVSAWAQAT